MFIRSERLFLRPGWPEDREELLHLMQHERDMRDEIDCVRARGCFEDAGEPLLPRFLVTLPGGAGARVIGGAGFFRLAGEVNLACWIVRDHGGHGYGSEAVRAVLSLARTLGHGRILASHLPGNAPAARLMEKAGFRPTGRFVECVAAIETDSGPGRAHEYELVFGAPSDCDDQPEGRRNAA